MCRQFYQVYHASVTLHKTLVTGAIYFFSWDSFGCLSHLDLLDQNGWFIHSASLLVPAAFEVLKLLVMIWNSMRGMNPYLERR